MIVHNMGSGIIQASSFTSCMSSSRTRELFKPQFAHLLRENKAVPISWDYCEA